MSAFGPVWSERTRRNQRPSHNLDRAATQILQRRDPVANAWTRRPVFERERGGGRLNAHGIPNERARFPWSTSRIDAQERSQHKTAGGINHPSLLNPGLPQEKHIQKLRCSCTRPRVLPELTSIVSTVKWKDLGMFILPALALAKARPRHHDRRSVTW